MNHKLNKYLGSSLLLALLVSTGCAEDDSPATLNVVLESEDTIINGLTPGVAVENIKDGWSVTYDRFITTVGPITLTSTTNSSLVAEASQVQIVDLKKVPPGGMPLWKVETPTDGAWEFRYKTPAAVAGAVVHNSVTAADATLMQTKQWTYLISGTLSKADGQSCPPAALATPGGKQTNGNMSGTNPCYPATSVRFEIGTAAATDFGPCEVDEIPGVTLNSEQEQTAAVTIHGDHLFFNGFPEGDEGGVMRLAQWLADCDLNLDGVVTVEELAAIAPGQLHEIDSRYQLGGSPITPLRNMYEFAKAQLKTQGHFQGEGECPVDGKAHDHGHGHGGHDDHAGHGHG